ncbi:hypothetical protein RUM43_011305 [Polyplax serrata]|uniref:Uncharacterized protein n=1 Tax=Polyplax serrata TaxID=468196 RepID=A0AAN8S0Z6_POLSC
MTNLIDVLKDHFGLISSASSRALLNDLRESMFFEGQACALEEGFKVAYKSGNSSLGQQVHALNEGGFPKFRFPATFLSSLSCPVQPNYPHFRSKTSNFQPTGN